MSSSDSYDLMVRRAGTPNMTPFIPPLGSPSGSPQPPVIPPQPSQLSSPSSSSSSQQNHHSNPSTPWFATSYPSSQGGAGPASGAYPHSAYPAFVAPGGGGNIYTPMMSPMGMNPMMMGMVSPQFIPPYLTPTGMPPGVIPPGVMVPNMSPSGITPSQLGGGIGGQFPIGVSADYSGYPSMGGGTTPFNGNIPLAGAAQPQQRGYQQFAPPQSWGQGGMPGGFGGGGGGGGGGGQWAYVTPGPSAHQPLAGGGGAWGMDAMTAGMGGMGFGAPAGYAGFGGEAPPSIVRRPMQDHEGDRVDEFSTGEHYGPVLTPFILHIVRAKLKLNPILMPPSLTTGAYLDWNLLFSSSNAHLSTDPSHKSWSTGRDAPATFPRVTQLVVITSVKTFPWYSEVFAKDPAIGVTCGEIAEVLAADLGRLTKEKDWNALPGRDMQAAVSAAYRRNRGREAGVPGGILGEGMKRLDYLREHVWWGGLEVVDPEASSDSANIMRKWLNQNPGNGAVVGMPCVVVLRTESMMTRSVDEVNEWDRSRHSRQNTGRGRQRGASGSGAPASNGGGGGLGLGVNSNNSRSRSRAGSRGAASRPGSRVGVRMEELSSDEEEDSSNED